MKRPVALIAEMPLLAFPRVPADVADTREVPGTQPDDAPKQVSRRNWSPRAVVSPLTMSVAFELNATNSSPLMAGLPPPAAVPSIATEISVVVGTQPGSAPLQVSRRNTHVLVQTDVFGRMFVASESNATKRPSELTAESKLWKFVAAPLYVTEIRVVLGTQPEGAEPRHVSRK